MLATESGLLGSSSCSEPVQIENLRVYGVEDAAHALSLLSGRITYMSYRGKTEKFRLSSGDLSTSELVQNSMNTIRDALCVRDPDIVLEYVQGTGFSGMDGGEGEQPQKKQKRDENPHFLVKVPPDFDLEDLAELSSKSDDGEAVLETLRLRYGSIVDRWLGMCFIPGCWQLLLEDALFVRMEGSNARGAPSMLDTEWLQEPAWGPCEWLMMHKRKDNTYSNWFNPAVRVRLKRRDDGLLDAKILESARLVLLSSGGQDVSVYDTGNKTAERNLRYKDVQIDEKERTIAFEQLGIMLPSEKYPSSRGMRPGKKRTEGCTRMVLHGRLCTWGWYISAMGLPASDALCNSDKTFPEQME